MTTATTTEAPRSLAELGKNLGRNHYAQPCFACGKTVRAWKGNLYRSADDTHRVAHSCCSPFMAWLTSH